MKTEYTLLASGPSLESIKGCIRSFYYMEKASPVIFTETKEGVYSITTHKLLNGVHVRKQGRRFRFEAVMP